MHTAKINFDRSKGSSGTIKINLAETEGLDSIHKVISSNKSHAFNQSDKRNIYSHIIIMNSHEKKPQFKHEVRQYENETIHYSTILLS
jgi:hypothetical protein